MTVVTEMVIPLSPDVPTWQYVEAERGNTTLYTTVLCNEPRQDAVEFSNVSWTSTTDTCSENGYTGRC